MFGVLWCVLWDRMGWDGMRYDLFFCLQLSSPFFEPRLEPRKVVNENGFALRHVLNKYIRAKLDKA